MPWLRSCVCWRVRRPVNLSSKGGPHLKVSSPTEGIGDDRRPGIFARRQHRPFDRTVAEDGEALDCGRDPAVGEGGRRARLVPREGLERVLSPEPREWRESEEES